MFTNKCVIFNKVHSDKLNSRVTDAHWPMPVPQSGTFINYFIPL